MMSHVDPKDAANPATMSRLAVNPDEVAAVDPKKHTTMATKIPSQDHAVVAEVVADAMIRSVTIRDQNQTRVTKAARAHRVHAMIARTTTTTSWTMTTPTDSQPAC